MSGSGFSARALMDYSLWTHIWFRGMFGLENFKAEGGNICGAANNTLCSVDISYLSLDLWGRYLFSTGAIRPWVGIGFNLLFPSSKSSTALEEKSITSTSVIAPGGGVDWFLSPDMYIPIQVEYGLYPPSDTVKANNISIRLGIGMHF
jgi:outer membrane protein W